MISVAPEAVETSFNPVYSTHASEYSTVVKSKQMTSFTPVTQVDPPIDLRPLPDQKPVDVQPIEVQ